MKRKHNSKPLLKEETNNMYYYYEERSPERSMAKENVEILIDLNKATEGKFKVFFFFKRIRNNNWGGLKT